MSEFANIPISNVILGDSEVPVADESDCNYYSYSYFAYNYDLCGGQFCDMDYQCWYNNCDDSWCSYSSDSTNLVWLWWVISVLIIIITIVIIVVICCIKKKKRQQAELQHALYQENG